MGLLRCRQCRVLAHLGATFLCATCAPRPWRTVGVPPCRTVGVPPAHPYTLARYGNKPRPKRHPFVRREAGAALQVRPVRQYRQPPVLPNASGWQTVVTTPTAYIPGVLARCKNPVKRRQYLDRLLRHTAKEQA